MKASALFVNEEYAYTAYPTRGKLPLHATKVRLRGTETKKHRFDTNAKTYAKITIVETGRQLTVRAREIIAFWDEYQSEIALINREKEERQQALKQAKEQHEAKAEVLARRLEEATGIKMELEYYSHSGKVSLAYADLALWLGIHDA